MRATTRVALHGIVLSLVSGCVCIFLAWDAPRQQFIQRLLALGIPLLVLVLTEPGAPSLDPGPLGAQPECFHVLPADAVAETLQRLPT